MSALLTSESGIVGPRGGLRWPSLISAMRAKGMDIETLAKKLSGMSDEVAPRTVEAWLRGERDPTLARLDEIAAVVGVAPGDLVGDRPRRKNVPAHHTI